MARPPTPSAKNFSSPLFLFASWSIRCPKPRHPRSLTCTFNCVYILLAVDDQMTLLGITGHNIRGWHWMGMCESVSDSLESLCNPRPRRDGPVILEQRHRSCLLIRVKTPVKQSKLIEKPATTNNEWMTWISQPGPSLAARSPVNCYSLVRMQKNCIPWSQHSVRFTNIREHCVSRPWALRNCQNPWDSRGIRETWQVCIRWKPMLWGGGGVYIYVVMGMGVWVASATLLPRLLYRYS